MKYVLIYQKRFRRSYITCNSLEIAQTFAKDYGYFVIYQVSEDDLYKANLTIPEDNLFTQNFIRFVEDTGECEAVARCEDVPKYVAVCQGRRIAPNARSSVKAIEFDVVFEDGYLKAQFSYCGRREKRVIKQPKFDTDYRLYSGHFSVGNYIWEIQ